MVSRRDALRLIAATSAAHHLPFATSPQDAAARLDVSPDAPIHDPALNVPLPSAVAFADGMTHRMWDGVDWGAFGEGAPQEWVAVEKLLAEVGDDAPHSEALRDLSTAVTSLAIASWYAGARVGAELEGVRRAMLRPIRLCSHCWGSGRQDANDPAPCSTCAGAGTVPTATV